MPVIGFDLTFRRLLADGTAWGDVGPYEELRGTLRFAIDPMHPANTRMTDVDLAPRNRAGQVEFASDVSIVLPVERARGNGRLLLDVVNRGNRVALPNLNRAPRLFIGPEVPIDAPLDLGDGFLMRRGVTVVACGWQVDAPDYPALITLRQGHAAPGLRGRVYMQLQSLADTPNFLLSDKDHKAYPTADLDDPEARLEVRDMPDGEAQPVPRHAWRFGRLENGRYVPDPRYICSEQGFQKGRLYQIVYTTDWAPILSLGFAALRDCVSWFKYGSPAVSPPIETVRYAYAYGRSQTGRYLRTYLYHDFNLDEQGREVFDGMLITVAGGMRGEFNQRFGQNSKDRNHMLPQLFPFTNLPQTDPETGQTDALRRRLDARGSPLKVIDLNSSAEYHRGDASLIHTDPEGRVDVEAGPHARVYHVAGSEHSLGNWPPTDVAQTGDGENRAQNLRSVVDYAPLLRACFVNLDRWVVEGVEPPPSRHPRLDDGSAVPPAALKPVFDRIPGAHYPAHHPLPRRLDFGLRRDVEQVTLLPPKVGKPYGSRVSAVDDDGNEIAGLRLPEVAVPLATHTGWTLRHPDIGGEQQLLVFAGGTLPFAADAAERQASGDPRPSIAERYASKDAYLEHVRQAAEKLVAERYLLAEDLDVCLAQARTFWDWFATGRRHREAGRRPEEAP